MRELLALLVAGPLLAQSAEQMEFFENRIRPIFAAKCYVCHGQDTKTGLDFASGAAFEQVIVPGDASQSRLYRAVSYADKIKMPPPGRLPDRQIADLKIWIDMGAPSPKAASPPPMSGSESQRIREGRKFWAFQPVKDYAPPKVNNEAWVKTPIDQFILAKLEEKGIRPAAPAAKLMLLRRVTYDLIGLPPTPKEIDDFLADKSTDAYAKVVERLLSSPQYGEHWGRHWLDTARYADSTGMDEDHLYPYGWRYRDYVIGAFNDNLPYDRFILEQLAGDLLPGEKPGAANARGIVATGFLALGPKPLAQQDRMQMIYDVVDEQIDVTSRAFMGLTLACARCHDHKFDPILTKDYYSLASIFASALNFKTLGDGMPDSIPYEAALDPQALDRYEAHRWRTHGKQLEMEDALAEDWIHEYSPLRPKVGAYLLAAWKVERKGITTAAAAGELGLDAARVEKWSRWLHAADEQARKGYLKNVFDAEDANIAQVTSAYQEEYNTAAAKWDARLEEWRRIFAARALEGVDVPPRPSYDRVPREENAGERSQFFGAVTFKGGPMELTESGRTAYLRAEWKQLQATLPPAPQMANAVHEGAPVQQRVFIRGDHHNPGPAVAKQFPVVLAGEEQRPVTRGSGRLELAKWLASPEHPLTARVMVNRIWQWHFGEALMRTPNNWGKTGETPTHPELIDYLAKRFVESGWSIKAMHRLILLSNTYQMESRTSQEVGEADPANRLWSRTNRVRMSVEQIRDSFLTFGGSMDATVGGSTLPTPATRGAGRPRRVELEDNNRRTLYITVRRDSIPTVLATFDFGDATTPGEGRPRTNVAPQALFILNSRFVVEQAGRFAKRLLDDATLTDAQRVERAYLMVLARQPDATERDAALTYIGGLEKKMTPADAHQAAWQSFCHVLMSTNEFLYLE